MGAAVAAVIVAKEREIVDAFRDAGAVSTVTARPLDQVGVDENIGFRRLRAHEVIREATPGRYYLDEGVWVAVRRTRRRVMVVLLAVVVFFGAGTSLGWFVR
jgi:transposase-like protein